MWLVRVFCDRYMIAEERGAPDLRPLYSRILYHGELVSSDLPGDVIAALPPVVEEVGDAIEELREMAEDAHAVLSETELSTRRPLAEELENLDEFRKLFGDIPAS
jgi:predicted RNase H-like HicB family nuclease